MGALRQFAELPHECLLVTTKGPVTCLARAANGGAAAPEQRAAPGAARTASGTNGWAGPSARSQWCCCVPVRTSDACAHANTNPFMLVKASCRTGHPAAGNCGWGWAPNGKTYYPSAWLRQNSLAKHQSGIYDRVKGLVGRKCKTRTCPSWVVQRCKQRPDSRHQRTGGARTAR